MHMPNHLLLLHPALFALDNSAKRLMSFKYRKQTFLGSTDGDGRIANGMVPCYTLVLFFNYFKEWRSRNRCHPGSKQRTTGVWMQSTWKEMKKNRKWRNSLVVQSLGLCAFTAKGPGSIPGQGTKMSQARQCSQKKEKKKWNSSSILLIYWKSEFRREINIKNLSLWN